MTDRIALITPWPPDHSGIADFARELAQGLRDAGLAVEVFTNASSPTPEDDIPIHRVPPMWNGDALAPFRHRLYQLGNHETFHGWMLAAMARSPGVVEVHDIALHHLLAALTIAKGHRTAYVRAVHDWYGAAMASTAEEPLDGNGRPIWETTAVVDLPFFELFLHDAEGVIVHSRHAATRVARSLPHVPLRTVMQSYRHEPTASRQALRRIGIFGGLQANKRLDWTLEAFRALGPLMAGIKVTVAGAIVPDCEYLVDAARDLKHLSIRFVGRLDETGFIDELTRSDLCLSLRHPTMGETSAIVMRALQLGVPTIVSETGWYAELPPDVLKAPLDDTPAYLFSRIRTFVTEPDTFRSWAARCAAMPALLKISHRRMCADIVDFLESHLAESHTSAVVASKLVDIGLTGDGLERDLVESLEPRVRLA